MLSLVGGGRSGEQRQEEAWTLSPAVLHVDLHSFGVFQLTPNLQEQLVLDGERGPGMDE